MELATILAAAFVILIIAVIAVASIKIVNQYERVLVFTHSGKKGGREAYRFTVGTDHSIRFAKDVSTG